jgi:N-acylneuraminate cytidylyltransferase
VSREILAIVPVSGQDAEFRKGLPQLGGRPLLDFTFDAIRESRLIRRSVVTTDSRRIAEASLAAGMEAPFLRSARTRRQPIGHVLRDVVIRLEAGDRDYHVDWVVQLHVTYPFRDRGFIDGAIRTVLAQPVDSAFVVFPEYESFWHLDAGGQPRRITTDVSVPRARRTPIYRELGGLFSMISREVVMSGGVHGERVAIIPTRSAVAPVDVHGTHGFQLGNLIARGWKRQ